MMRGLSLQHPAPSNPSASLRGARVVRPWLGGFNLLPYRQTNARAARRRCLREWAAAAFAGCAAVLALAAWQAIGKARIDAQRASIEQSLTRMGAPLAEHAKLTRAQDEQRKDLARATSLSEPLAHLRDLLDALSFEPGDGVVLRQLHQREHDTELLATSRGHIASAEWLKRLGAIRGVKGVEMSDLHRPALRGSAPVDESVTGPIEFGAHLHWDEPTPKAAHVPGSTSARSVKSEPSRGAK
jgi:Tfp pilus assembly protein PilN